MESRDNFFSGGEWCSDTLEERYEHIKDVLELYNKKNKKGKRGIDLTNLKYIIKNAFVSKIYISEGTKQKLEEYDKYKNGKNWKLKKLYEKICNDGYLELPGETDGLSHFDFCKVINLQVKDSKEKNKKLGLRIEHVVPGKVYIDDVLDLLDPQKEKEGEFKKIFDKVYICIVTEEEDKKLNKYRDEMPKNDNGDSIDYKENPFARYDECGISIFKPVLY